MRKCSSIFLKSQFNKALLNHNENVKSIVCFISQSFGRPHDPYVAGSNPAVVRGDRSFG
jgi:hypothetical protein